MYAINFPAVLKTEDNQILEKGFASVSVQNKTVDFKSEFVPLLKYGTNVKIIRTLGKQELHLFTGTVYLSSRQLLRITAVKDEVLANAEYVHSVNTSIKAQATAVEATPPKFKMFHKKKKQAPAVFDILVYSLSMNNIRFTSPQPFPRGQKLTLSCREPYFLENMELEVFQVIAFGDEVTGHHCKIAQLPEDSKIPLEEFVKTLNQKSTKLF